MSTKKSGLALKAYLLEQKYAPDALRVASYLKAGKVLVNGKVCADGERRIHSEDKVEISQEKNYVGRGAKKLLAAFEYFPLKIQGALCADFGSSTGGFTEVMLEKGARKVYAIDIAYGELDYRLRQDARVLVRERQNILELEALPEKLDFISIDLSFVSLHQSLPVAASLLGEGGCVVALLKPQYEAGALLPEGAVIEDAKLHERILREFQEWLLSSDLPLVLKSIEPSPILGGGGNKEFLVYLVKAK